MFSLRSPAVTHPEEFVAQLRKLSRAEAIRTWSSTRMLVICVADAGEVLNTLLATSTAAGAPLVASRDGIGFATNLATVPKMKAAMDLASGPPRATATTLRGLLGRKPYFIAPLRKRETEGKPFAERISVGRARNNDIVLRHETVSKFHAWFESDYDDVVWITDAKSTNKTFVGGKELVPNEATQVPEGTEVRFGDVVSILCSPGLVWDALSPA